MRDYEELVNSLKNCVYIPCNETQKEKCLTCKENDCRRELMAIAANAITELVSNADKFKWISTAEQQPEKSGLYLTYHAKRGSMTMYYSANNDAWNVFDHEKRPEYALEVTHWMPLPEPPEVKK